MNNFLKNKNSFFNIIGILILLFTSIIYISNYNKEDYHGYMRVFSILGLFLSFSLFLIDFILRRFIKEKNKLNFIETTISAIIILIFLICI